MGDRVAQRTDQQKRLIKYAVIDGAILSITQYYYVKCENYIIIYYSLPNTYIAFENMFFISNVFLQKYAENKILRFE